MARITVEDCLTRENNRFALVQLASKRTKQLLSGSRPLTPEARGNKAVVTALREIAGGCVRFMTEEDRARLEELRALNPQIDDTTDTEDFLSTSNGSESNGSHRAAISEDLEDMSEIVESEDEGDLDDDEELSEEDLDEDDDEDAGSDDDESEDSDEERSEEDKPAGDEEE